MMKESIPIQVFVISLERSLDRRQRVKEQLAKTGIHWTFLNAVDGYALSKMPPSYNKDKVKRLQGYELTPGEVGCYLSHIKAWQACVDNQKTTLVFEDDFLLEPGFDSVLSDLLAIHKAWDLVRLSGIYETENCLLESRETYELVQNFGDPCGTASYILNPQAACILLKNSPDIYEPVDHYLEHFKKHGLRCLAVKPYPVLLAHTRSTITDRPGRQPVQGWKKMTRSFYRYIDRIINQSPWFPKT